MKRLVLALVVTISGSLAAASIEANEEMEVTGRLTTQVGRPVAAIDLKLTRVRTASVPGEDPIITRTNGVGEFSVKLRAGKFRVTMDPPCFEPFELTVAPTNGRLVAWVDEPLRSVSAQPGAPLARMIGTTALIGSSALGVIGHTAKLYGSTPLPGGVLFGTCQQIFDVAGDPQG